MTINKAKQKSKKGYKKGFIFTLLALLVIAFMIIEVSIYFSTYQLRQESSPMNIRTRIVEEFATQLALENVQKVSRVSAYTALYSLTHDSIARPLSPSLANISNVAGTVFWNGTRIDTNTQLIENGTLKQWKENLENLSSQSGLNLTVSCTGFNVTQTDPWTVQFNYTFAYSMSDDYTKTKISDAYNVSVNVQINGFEDPLFANRTTGTSNVRNIFPLTLTKPDKLVNTNTGNGRGWFYGDVFNGGSVVNQITESDFNPDNKKKILYTENFNIVSTYGNMFGAVIYHGDRYIEVGNAVSVPFVAVPLSQSIPTLPSAVLIKSGSDTDFMTGNFTVYDIETQKNFASCGYYVNDSDAPSFFDRLVVGRPDVRVFGPTSQFGIETALVGIGAWINSPNKASTDHEYYNTTVIPGVKVMGLTGCKFYEMCKDSTSPKFKVSTAHVSKYGLDELVCSGSRCG